MIKYIGLSLFTLNFLFFIACPQMGCAQPLNKKKEFTRQDTLRGSIGPGRAWWDVKSYNLSIKVDIEKKEISGSNQISFDVLQPGKNKEMQIDLQQPMEIEKILYGPQLKEKASFRREGNVYWVRFGEKEFVKNTKLMESIHIYFKGKPRVAVNPPWDGGWIWTKDAKGRPWITVACQGLGASVWYPCKDHQSDEPENGAVISVVVPDSLVVVANGMNLPPNESYGKKHKVFHWIVRNPINNYNIVPYIGKYVNWQQVYNGEKGALPLDYWVLDYNLEKSKAQFGRDVKPMLKCFEYWFGPYPFYEDGYKLVETPHLGMEHQSAVAYGNHYVNGYYIGNNMGMDLSGSGWGEKWDYIIVHESGHEWFGNNITTNDIADMWVHEGFTDYSETLFVECQYGKQAANEYTQGLRRGIGNKQPIIGHYGVNQEGSSDMYNKGNNLIHTIRQVINDDTLFRKILRGLNSEFYHKTVDSKQVEAYISRSSGKDFSPVFDQYLRTPNIPVLEYKILGDRISYRWSNTVKGFNMPVKILPDTWIKPGSEWQSMTGTAELVKNFTVDPNFYIVVKKVE